MDNTKGHNNTKKQAVLFVLLDAFRWDYLNQKDSPTLWSLSHQGIYAKKLISSSGFTQRSAIFTGAPSDVHGNYTMYTYDPKTSPFKILKPFVPILRHITPSLGKFYSFTRRVINQIPKLSTDWAPPAVIPSDILYLISVTEDLSPIYHPKSLPVESIFDVFTAHNVPYEYMMAPVSGHDEPTMQRMLQAIHPSTQMYFVQFSDTDGLVHRDGVKSSTRHSTVQEVDKRVATLKKRMEEVHHNPWIIVIGDHGMVDVETYVDIQNPVLEYAKKHSLVHGKDFLMFLDSTLARFWFFTPNADPLKNFVKELLSAQQGLFLTAEYMKARNIPIGDRRFGDLIWKADVPTGIFPDYFHSYGNQYKAMHGYDSLEESMKGMAIVSHPSYHQSHVIEEANLIDLASTICDIFQLPSPSHNKGSSFFLLSHTTPHHE